MLTAAVDFDGVLVDPHPLRWRPHARAGLEAMLRSGWRVILHSNRAGLRLDERSAHAQQEADEFYGNGLVPADVEQQWARFGEMREFLRAAGLWDRIEVWQRAGRPAADLTVDDRFGPQDWLALGPGRAVR